MPILSAACPFASPSTRRLPTRALPIVAALMRSPLLRTLNLGSAVRDISKAILGRSVPRNPQKIPAYESLRWYPFAVAQSPGKSDADTTQRASRHGQDRVFSLGLAAYVVLAIAAFSPAPSWDTSRLASTPFGTYGFGEHASSTPDGQLLVWLNNARQMRAGRDQ